MPPSRRAHTRSPAAPSFDTNTSESPAEVKSKVPAPGSKSAVPEKEPVTYTLPDPSTATPSPPAQAAPPPPRAPPPPPPAPQPPPGAPRRSRHQHTRHRQKDDGACPPAKTTGHSATFFLTRP